MRFVLVWALMSGSTLLATEPAPPNPDPTVAAVVNGDVIRLAQVDELIRREFQPRSPFTSEQAQQIRKAAVEDMIDDLLLKQFLREHGPVVTPAEVDKHLHALAISLRRQRRTLEEYYRETGRTEADVRDTWTNLLRFQKYVDARATEEELRKYHTLYKDLFDRVAVKAQQIVVRVPAGSPPGEWTAARQKLTSLKQDITTGKLDFATAAKRYSIDPTAADGGVLGWIARRDAQLDETFCRAAFALQPGQISEPVDTPNSVVLIRVSERKPGRPTTFESVADLVRECYTEDVRRELVRQLRGKSAIQVTIP